MSSIQPKWVACLWIENIGITVEQARLPHLEGEAFVLASTDGIIQAVSKPVAAWGVRRGMATQSARSLCDDLIVLPYDRTVYDIAARTVWDILAVENSVVEPVSPELVYVELRATQAEVTSRLCHQAEIIAPRVGVSIQIGVGKTKFVARQAAQGRQEEGKTVLVPLGEEASFLARLPLSLLPNAGKLDQKAKQQIERLGIKTLGDIWALPPHRSVRLWAGWGL